MANAFLVVPLALPAVFADSSAAGTSPSYLDNDYIGVVHRTPPTTSAFVRVDFLTPVAANVVAFLATSGNQANWIVRGSTTSTPSGDVFDAGTLPFAAGSAVPSSGRQNSFLDLGAARTARHWYAQMDNGGSPFEAGRLVIGTKFQPGRNFSFGASFGLRDLGAVDFSRAGVPLLTPGARLRTVGLGFTNVSRSEAEAQLQPLLDTLGNTRTVLLVTDPAVDALRSRRMYFGYLVGDLSTLWRVADGWEWRCNLVSLI